MTFPPDRLGALIGRIEAGNTVTQTEVDRVATLQALDIARMGREFVQEAISQDTALSKTLESAT